MKKFLKLKQFIYILDQLGFHFKQDHGTKNIDQEILEGYYKKIMEANKMMNEESNRIISWTLSIIGGTILTIISTEYVEPVGCIKYFYLLFIVGWLFLAKSIYHGQKITRIFIAGFTVNETDKQAINEIGKKIDTNFAHQIESFRNGIIIFTSWLIIFLIWFIFKK